MQYIFTTLADGRKNQLQGRLEGYRQFRTDQIISEVHSRNISNLSVITKHSLFFFIYLCAQRLQVMNWISGRLEMDFAHFHTPPSHLLQAPYLPLKLFLVGDLSSETTF